ncbi:hypothetical protein PIB30_023550 [Stylosanthes scabra]|uniref:Uncharacterized protein n=1 Tax=Stylosanthes scabra TaxID=79078 RepID=A0ABU6W8Z9_9FABA|nr:hypothetical protein [Stylosanthes scabra]
MVNPFRLPPVTIPTHALIISCTAFTRSKTYSATQVTGARRRVKRATKKMMKTAIVTPPFLWATTKHPTVHTLEHLLIVANEDGGEEDLDVVIPYPSLSDETSRNRAIGVSKDPLEILFIDDEEFEELLQRPPSLAPNDEDVNVEVNETHHGEFVIDEE